MLSLLPRMLTMWQWCRSRVTGRRSLSDYAQAVASLLGSRCDLSPETVITSRNLSVLGFRIRREGSHALYL